MILIKVSVGVILNEKKTQVFLTKRKFNKDFGGLWEFPGGKIEKNENAIEALTRELNEELGILVKRANLLINITHHYLHQNVNLYCFNINQYYGKLTLNEGQKGRWIEIPNLTQKKCQLQMKGL